MMGWTRKPRPGQVIDARPWMIAPHFWVSATRLAVSGSSVTVTVSGRADPSTPIQAGTVIGNIPAEYRTLIEIFALGQNVGGEGMRFLPNGDIAATAIAANSYFKVSTSWTR